MDQTLIAQHQDLTGWVLNKLTKLVVPDEGLILHFVDDKESLPCRTFEIHQADI